MGNLSNFHGINLVIGSCSQAGYAANDCFSITGMLQAIACWLGGLAIIILVVFLIIYGLSFMLAQGNPGKVTSAKQALLWGLVGGLVILGTYTIISSIAAFFGANIPNFPFNCSIFLNPS